MRPLDGLVRTRTGSRCSRVGPAVMTMVLPRSRPPATSSRPAVARIVSGSLMRPGCSLGPSASGPASGPTKCQPRAASAFRVAWGAGGAYIASFMAGGARAPAARARDAGGRRAARRTASDLLAPPPHQPVLEPRPHQLVQGAGRELLL